MPSLYIDFSLTAPVTAALNLLPQPTIDSVTHMLKLIVNNPDEWSVNAYTHNANTQVYRAVYSDADMDEEYAESIADSIGNRYLDHKTASQIINLRGATYSSDIEEVDWVWATDYLARTA